MSQSIDDGGPAFPSEEQIRCNGEVCDSRKFTGMTLRDYFAAAALSSRGMYGANIRENAVAKECYIIADAMLKARGDK